ncbi:hypothetical protein [Halosolutus halophilus]|uniref:hypothetical protein n=1 Tax=Halosolutus halophilus TaxID=1552990 RepID=UPI0022352850|nr:hypothetical protein [Halosolutus halophilus]
MAAHAEHAVPELPSLDPEVTLLESTAPGPLHALVVDHVLMERSTAWWIDTHGYAQTEPLVRISPSQRILDRIQVARAFTAYQHYTLCERLLGDERFAAPGVDEDDVGLVIVPAIDAFYRDDDLQECEGHEMLVHALARLAGAARRYDCPVLVSRTDDDAFAEPVASCATDRLECEETSEGPRFSGENFETLVYSLGDGWVQTTLAFWATVLEQREAVYPTAITAGSISEVA